jgi:SAM-dependent methyltransferase
MLDFEAALAEGAQPPLPHADGSFDEIRALEAFTRLADGWAEWLLELRRLLTGDGQLFVGLADPSAFESLSGEPWEESRIGMTVLSALNGARGSIVFHSEWWLRAHWGRAFEIVAVEHRDGRRTAILRSSGVDLSAADLEFIEPGEERELEAARANAAYLRGQLELAERRHRGELEEQREEMNRELMRRAFAAADLEWSRRGAGSPAMLVAVEYESTTSWKITKPLRALGRMLRRSS